MKLREHIRAVSFDVGGTLIEPWPSVGHIYAEVAARHGVSAPAEELNRGFAASWRARGDFGYTQGEWFALVRQTFGERAAQLPEAFFPAVYRRFAEADAWRIHDDVLPVLDHLTSRGMPLAVVSNWDERLHELLAALRLRSYFDTVIVSCDVGFTKPSPVPFELALRRLGVPAGALLHIGDSSREDVAGAESAGAKALLVERTGAASISGGIRSLRELEALF